MSSHFYKPLGESGPQVTSIFDDYDFYEALFNALSIFLTFSANRDNVGFRFYSTVWRWASSNLYKCYCRTATVAPETGIKKSSVKVANRSFCRSESIRWCIFYCNGDYSSNSWFSMRKKLFLGENFCWKKLLTWFFSASSQQLSCISRQWP